MSSTNSTCLLPHCSYEMEMNLLLQGLYPKVLLYSMIPQTPMSSKNLHKISARLKTVQLLPINDHDSGILFLS